MRQNFVVIRRYMISIFIGFGILISSKARATIKIPTNLNSAERRQATRILGFSTSSKLLSDPYPLGGYSGFEIGIALESMQVGDLGHIGGRLATPQQEISYPKLTIGKGLYNNIDFFLQFTPYIERIEISHYGGILRWGFYQGTSFPFNLSALVHLNNANFNNQITTRTYGIDFITGINVDSVALYAGGGPLECRGRFNGGRSDINDPQSGTTSSGLLETENVYGSHLVFGASLRWDPSFLSMQIDRYDTTVYSAKVGIRF